MSADYQLRADPGDGNDSLEVTVRLQERPVKGELIAVWDAKSGSTMQFHGQLVWQGSETYLEVIDITHMPAWNPLEDPFTYVEVRLQYPSGPEDLKRAFEALKNDEQPGEHLPYVPPIDVQETLTNIEHLARVSAEDPLTLPTIQKLAAEALEEQG